MQRPQHLKATYHDMRADRRTDFSDAGRLVYRAIEARDAGGVESAALPAPRRQRTKLEDGLSENTAEHVLIGCDTGAIEMAVRWFGKNKSGDRFSVDGQRGEEGKSVTVRFVHGGS